MQSEREREREREREKVTTAGLLDHLSGAGNFSKIRSASRQYQLQYTTKTEYAYALYAKFYQCNFLCIMCNKKLKQTAIHQLG